MSVVTLAVIIGVVGALLLRMLDTSRAPMVTIGVLPTREPAPDRRMVMMDR